jgi:hypothetical protein
MNTLEGIAAEILPVDKFGEYLRSHMVSRYEQHMSDVVRRVLGHFNPHLPESIVGEWFDELREAENEHWREKVLPAILESHRRDAEFFKKQHFGDEEE